VRGGSKSPRDDSDLTLSSESDWQSVNSYGSVMESGSQESSNGSPAHIQANNSSVVPTFLRELQDNFDANVSSTDSEISDDLGYILGDHDYWGFLDSLLYFFPHLVLVLIIVGIVLVLLYAY
jgi:hypothetical protein